jgi:hypothetical protein
MRISLGTLVLSGWLTQLALTASAQPEPVDGPPFGPSPQPPPAAPVRVVEAGTPVWHYVVVAMVATTLTICIQQLVRRAELWIDSTSEG